MNVTGLKESYHPLFLVTMSKINIDEKSKPIRKYAGRTIAFEKQNYKTSKIAWGTSTTSWTFLINCGIGEIG